MSFKAAKKTKIELWPALAPTLFFWKTARIHLLSVSCSESSKVCLRLQECESRGIPVCSRLESAAGSRAAEGNRPCDEGWGREMKGISSNTLGSIRRMLCLAWAGLTWCLSFFSYNAGKIDIREIREQN